MAQRAPIPMPPAAALLLIGGGASLLAWIAIPLSHAQISPKCERNGRRDYCALTPLTGASTATQTVDLIMFADDSVYEVVREQASCRPVSSTVETCSARITTPPPHRRTIPAVYRRTQYEGGAKHEYQGRGLRISYVVVD